MSFDIRKKFNSTRDTEIKKTAFIPELEDMQIMNKLCKLYNDGVILDLHDLFPVDENKNIDNAYDFNKVSEMLADPDCQNPYIRAVKSLYNIIKRFIESQYSYLTIRKLESFNLDPCKGTQFKHILETYIETYNAKSVEFSEKMYSKDFLYTFCMEMHTQPANWNKKINNLIDVHTYESKMPPYLDLEIILFYNSKTKKIINSSYITKPAVFCNNIHLDYKKDSSAKHGNNKGILKKYKEYFDIPETYSGNFDISSTKQLVENARIKNQMLLHFHNASESDLDFPFKETYAISGQIKPYLDLSYLYDIKNASYLDGLKVNVYGGNILADMMLKIRKIFMFFHSRNYMKLIELCLYINSYLHYHKFIFSLLDFPANSINVWSDPVDIWENSKSDSIIDLPRKFLNCDPNNNLKSGETVYDSNPSNIQSFLIYALLNYFWYESKGFEMLNLSHAQDFSKAIHLGLSAYGGFKYCYDNSNTWPEPRLKEIFMNVKLNAEPSKASEKLMHDNIMKIRRILLDNGLLFDNIDEFSKESFDFNQKENQELVKFDISGLKDFLVTD